MGKRKLLDFGAVQAYYDQGHTWKKTANKFSVSEGCIMDNLKRGNLKTPMVRKNKAAYRLDMNCIQIEYNNGDPISVIEKRYGTTFKTLKTHGLITRPCSEATAISNRKHIWSEETKQKLSRLAKERGLGGYRPHPNKGTKYNGIWFDSQWEVTVAVDLDSHDIEWIRPKTGFVWNDEGRKYYPDFYLPEYDVYLDPKNPYLQVKDKTKITEAQKRNNIRVLMLGEDDLTWKKIQALIS